MRRYALIFGWCALCLAGSAAAGNVQTTSSMLLSVFDSCLLNTANDLKFGSYNPTSGVDSTTTNAFSVTCTKDTLVTVTTAVASGFKMKGPANQTLNYALYQDAGLTQLFGSGLGFKVKSLGILSPIAGTIYGRVPAQQDVTAGAYTDSVTLSFAF